MPTGTVKWFNIDKGYGFIEQAGGTDIFVHVTALDEIGLDTLRPGQEISFDVGTNSRNGKPNAINLRLL